MIEVNKWQDSSITGILQNDPFEIPALKAGAIVSTNHNVIFDYMYYQGNETGEIMSRGK